MKNLVIDMLLKKLSNHKTSFFVMIRNIVTFFDNKYLKKAQLSPKYIALSKPLQFLVLIGTRNLS